MIVPFPGIEVLFPGSLKWSVIILADEALKIILLLCIGAFLGHANLLLVFNSLDVLSPEISGEVSEYVVINLVVEIAASIHSLAVDERSRAHVHRNRPR